MYQRSITSIGKQIKNKQEDLLQILTTVSNDPRDSQRMFLRSIIKRYKFYFLSGYTMKFIKLIASNTDNCKGLLIKILSKEPGADGHQSQP